MVPTGLLDIYMAAGGYPGGQVRGDDYLFEEDHTVVAVSEQ